MEFEEKQNFKIWWLYLLTGITIFPTIAILIFYNSGPTFEELKQMYFAPIFAVLSPFLIIFLVQQSKLTLRVNEKGISYRYFPFHFKMSTLNWLYIDKVYMRNYDAFSEYGGYGIKNKLVFKFKDKAFLLNDKSRGLQIEFKNGKKLLFSSNKADELELFLINLKTKYHIPVIQ